MRERSLNNIFNIAWLILNSEDKVKRYFFVRKTNIAQRFNLRNAFSRNGNMGLGKNISHRKIGNKLLSAPLLSLFVDSADAVHYGQIRTLYIILPYFIAALNTILSNVIQAFGYSIFCTVNSIFSVFVFRMIWMRNIYTLCPTFHVLMQCFLVSWTLIAILNLIFFFSLYYGRFKKNKIKKMG